MLTKYYLLVIELHSLNKQNLLKGLNIFLSEDDIWCYYFPFYALPVLSILFDQKCSIWRVLGCSKLIFVLDRLTKKPPIETSNQYVLYLCGNLDQKFSMKFSLSLLLFTFLYLI